MPTPDNTCLTYDNFSATTRGRFLDAFQPPQIAAEVPAVQLTPLQWASICLIIETLSDLVDTVAVETMMNGLAKASDNGIPDLEAPQVLQLSLVQGSLIDEAAQKAWILKRDLGLGG